MISPLSRSRWIWSPDDTGRLDRWVIFRRAVELPAAHDENSRRQVHIAADGWYRLRINGRRIGEGPVRSWPDELFRDSYDISDISRNRESLELEILVRHYRPGSGFYIGGEPGLAMSLTETGGGEDMELCRSDETWQCAEHPGYGEVTAKISNGMAYAEVYREDKASESGNWNWKAAGDFGPAISAGHRIIPRDIPPLAEEILEPVEIVRQRLVKTPGFIRTVNLRPLVFPSDRDVNKHKRFSGILACGIRSAEKQTARIGLTVDPHDTEAVNFCIGDEEYIHRNGTLFDAELKSGLNILRIHLTGEYHDPEFHLHFDLPDSAELENPVEVKEASTPFVFLGPLTRSVHLQVENPVPPVPSEVLPLSVLKTMEIAKQPEYLRSSLVTVPAGCVSPHHVAMEAMSAAEVSGGVPSEDGESVHWTADGDAEIIWDFGREVSGFLGFEIDAPRDTILDVFCFESMHDGFIEHTYSLNNSLRYFCAEGIRSHESFLRRGFRYAMLRFRGPGKQAQLRRLQLRESLYPHDKEAEFRCSDSRFSDIWKISRQTVALCMEDTYVDCPAYEQAYWTGDARNTAIYSYYLFAAGPLFLRSARLAARSLERSPLIESHVPSGWQNVIPSWSFFHVIAGAEYAFYTGDREGLHSLYPSLFENMKNAADRRIPMSDGSRLFAMHAWNMVDWAPMDVPDDGIIAHQNAQFVLACRTLEKTAALLGFPDDAAQLRLWADEVSAAVNTWFWSDEREAYRDSLKRDETPSDTFSVQTQLFTYLADLAAGPRRSRLEEILDNPPPSFVQIGSPFVDHFLLEHYMLTNRSDRVLNRIRDVWGNMLDHGATTCWEGWSLIPGYHTRSHCHAWSAAPAYFLPSILLGIRPKAEGFSELEIAPCPSTLSFAEGSLPTPKGPVHVSWKVKNGIFSADIRHPEAVTVHFTPPEGLSVGSVNIVPAAEIGV